jgi:NAD(P)-dependent dehydrogenase (short-subunit alcohol dehydrogenase family)
MTEDIETSGAPGRVIVTGGSAGIGRAIVTLLASRGWEVGFTFNRRKEGAEALMAEVEGSRGLVVMTRADFSDPSSAARAVRELADRMQGLDALVNNAAINPRGTLLEENGEELRRAFAVNVEAPWHAAHAAARIMAEQGDGGNIVNVTSVLAAHPLSGAGAYCGTKAALDHFTRVWARELAQHGIRVNAVAPGYIDTDMNPDARGTITRMRGRDPKHFPIPLEREGEPAEIAEVVAFLLSGTSGYMTGASLPVDGGLPLVSGPEQLRRAIEEA